MPDSDDELEPKKRADDYPIDDLEREAAGLPPLSGDRRDKPRPPQLVQVSFLLWITSAVLLVAGFALMLLNSEEIANKLVEAYESALRRGEPVRDVTPEQIASGVPGLLWLLAAGGAMVAALFVLFSYKTQEGTRSARTVLFALLVLVIVFAVGMPGEFVNFLMILSIVAGGAGLIVLFLPGVGDYFPRLPRTRKRWRDFS